MTSREFCYWLQGYFEIMNPSLQGSAIPLGPAQVECIRQHLQTVFKHELAPPAPAAPMAPGGITWTLDGVSVC